MKSWIKNSIGLLVIIFVIVITSGVVRRFHTPGQLDVISAQAMDMSQMRPPSGAAPVALVTVRQGSLSDAVTYTGSILAFNEQDISPRITGRLVSLPVYPGDQVRAGQVVAQLDTAEVGAKADQAYQEARQAQLGAQVAHLTHHLHHQAALDQATAQVQVAEEGVSDAQAEAQADQSAISDAQAGVQSAQASADYWKNEIVREKQLADAGAVSQQEYQNELAQAQAATAALSQAQAKVGQARATAASARAKVQMEQRQVVGAQAGVRMAQADIAVAQGQAVQAEAGASAAQAAARTAAVEQGYSRITSPFDGVVTARAVAPGTLVQPGMVILKVAEIDRVRVQANVAVEDMVGVHVGALAAITVQGGDNDKTIAARITSVFPSASDQTRTATVEAVIPNPGHRLLPGAFVTMQITHGTISDKTLAPASSVVSQGGQSYVWIAMGGASASAGQVYECVICHIHYSAAQAAKFHYHDPMEGGKLVPLKGTQAAPQAGLTAHHVTVQVGASDGAWTEVSSDALTEGTRVVTQGQAGLTEGAHVVSTAWGENGPKTLPTAAEASSGAKRYRCEKCGMIFSEEDAKKHNFIDPMDGGRLVPVPPSPSANSMAGMKM